MTKIIRACILGTRSEGKDVLTFSYLFLLSTIKLLYKQLLASLGDSFTNWLLTTAYLHQFFESHWDPYIIVGSLSPVKCSARFQPGTFQFDSDT